MRKGLMLLVLLCAVTLMMSLIFFFPESIVASNQGGIFNYSVTGDVSFVPRQTGRNEYYVRTFIFNTLTTFNEDLEPVPFLAKSWETEDAIEWIFHLHDNVLWHDGEPFTAADVKFTYEQLMIPETGYRLRGNLADIKEMEIIDDYTIKFVTEDKFAPLPAMLAQQCFIMPKHLLEDDFAPEDFDLYNPIGTGAFKVDEVVRGQYIRLVANEDFFLGRPNFDEVVIRIIPDAETVVAQLMSGELDYGEIAPGRHLMAAENQPHLRIDSNVTTDYAQVMMDHTDPRFQCWYLRKALNYSIDRQAIIDEVMMGYAALPTSTCPPSIAWAYNNNLEPFPYDLEIARQYLIDGGYTMGEKYWERDGKPVNFTIKAESSDAVRLQNAVIVHQYWRDLGIDARLEVMDWSTWLSHWIVGNGIMNGYQSHNPEPHFFTWWHSDDDAGFNWFDYNNPAVDKYIDLAAREVDQEQRVYYLYRLQEELMNDVPNVILYYIEETLAMNKNLQGIQPYQHRYRLNWVHEWYFDNL